MAQQTATVYAGPGKVYIGTSALFPEGENGAITATLNQEKLDAASGMFGRQTSLQGDATVSIGLTPFDLWGALGVLFPAYLGVKVGATAAALKIGTRPHNPAGAGDATAKIWTPDGRLYTFNRAAITKHPDIHLGVDKGLFGPMEITAIGATGKMPGAAGFLMSIAESAGADPGGQMDMAGFARGRWTGVWGTVAGFGGDQDGLPVEAEDEWVITSEIKYSALKVQRLTRAFKLDSVAFMAKCRPFGPTQTHIYNALGLESSRTLGSRFAGLNGGDLVLTGPNGKTITLKNSDIVGAGFEFGGTKLGIGEVGFVNEMKFTAGAPDALLEFSA